MELAGWLLHARNVTPETDRPTAKEAIAHGLTVFALILKKR